MTVNALNEMPHGTTGARTLRVDLEPMLLRGNPVWESWFVLLRQNVGKAIRALGMLLHGSSRFAEYLGEAVEIEPDFLPYNESLLQQLRELKATGTTLVLVSALPRPWTEAISSHVGLFNVVMPKGPEASALPRVEAVTQREPATLRDWLREIRLHQWIKNFLVFVPLVASHRFGDRTVVQGTITAFLAFGCVASGNYILNDLIDLHHDRHHPTKRDRPLASGQLRIPSALLVMVTLLAMGSALAATLPRAFGEVLALYVAGTLAYSFRLKRTAPLDTFTLAGLYTLRVFAGNAATRLPPSFWLLAFSVFLFLSLAMAKRHAELLRVSARGDSTARGRGYQVADREMVGQLGVGAGYISVLVLALYLNSPQAALLYSRPGLLWLLCFLLLYWITRLWLVAHRGQLDDDPVIFAIRDRTSRYIAVAAAILLVLAR